MNELNWEWLHGLAWAYQYKELFSEGSVEWVGCGGCGVFQIFLYLFKEDVQRAVG